MSASEIVQEAIANGARSCDLEFSDIIGVAKAVTIPIDQLALAAQRGRWFDGSSLEGFARVGERDMYLRPALETLTPMPWGQPERVRVLCDVITGTGELFPGSPRSQLIMASDRIAELGYTYKTAPELEFFLINPEASFQPFDRGNYFDRINEQSSAFWRELLTVLEQMRVKVEASHHEAADGQYEIDLSPQPALESADALMTAKLAIRTVAARHGVRATFMPKPFDTVNGSGLHVHQCLVDRLGRNVFADTDNSENYLSSTAFQFIAGLLDHANGMSAIIAPLVNSYKRLVPSYEAPFEANWGHQAQEVMIRVPRLSSERLDELLIEIRSPDPSCNPYLAYAALLMAGMDGITRGLECPPPGTLLRRKQQPGRRSTRQTRLPESLAEALEALENDSLMRETLGEQIFAEFLEAKWQEWEQYRRTVSVWERDHYLLIY